MQKPGKSGRNRGLVKMDGTPEPKPYRRPPIADPGKDRKINYGLGWEITIRTWRYNGRLVDYAINQHWEGDDTGVKVKDIARIDCCHHHIHEHQFFKNGNPQCYVNIKELEQTTAWTTMQEELKVSQEHMLDKWNWHQERWERGY